MAEYLQGFFKPKNPHKYLGDPTKIVYRSSWEFKYCMKLDHDPNIVSWSSEEVIIPYRSPVDNRVHRYFVDFLVKERINNKIHTYLVEIKPKSQTLAPKRKAKQSNKKFLKEVFTYGVNEAKWKAATEYCKHRGWEFKILTEKELKV